MAKHNSGLSGPERRLTGVIFSYIKSGKSEKDRGDMGRLTKYIRRKLGVRVDPATLKKSVRLARLKLRRKRDLDRLEGRLLSRSGKARKFRFGRAFCPSCSMFKDYEKECPYCGHHEVTL